MNKKWFTDTLVQSAGGGHEAATPDSSSNTLQSSGTGGTTPPTWIIPSPQIGSYPYTYKYDPPLTEGRFKELFREMWKEMKETDFKKDINKILEEEDTNET